MSGKKFTQYDAETGEIVSVFTCLANEEPANYPCVEGAYSAAEYRIVDGAPVRKSQDEIESAAIKKAWSALRMRRSGMLKDTDWTQVPDAPVDQAAWAAYRQQLRDLPANTVDPANPVWPDPPV